MRDDVALHHGTLTGGSLAATTAGSSAWRVRGAGRESRDPGRRPRNAPERGDDHAPEADGGDRRAADPLAHHEDLRAHGLNDFVICCGYKGYVIKEYFSDYFLQISDVTFDMPNNTMEVHRQRSEPWRVTLVDTGRGDDDRRAHRARRRIIGDETFCLTYGDGVADVDIGSADRVPPGAGTLATLTAVQPPGRFGASCSPRAARDRPVPGEAARRRRVGERRLLRARAGGARLHRRRPTRSSKRSRCAN